MPISRRYSPEHPPGETCLFGMDFSFVLPTGTQITKADLNIYQNTFGVTEASADWTAGPVQISGRAVYAQLSGGVEGTDYAIRWTVTDSDSNIWPRTALVLCAQTS